MEIRAVGDDNTAAVMAQHRAEVAARLLGCSLDEREMLADALGLDDEDAAVDSDVLAATLVSHQGDWSGFPEDAFAVLEQVMPERLSVAGLHKVDGEFCEFCDVDNPSHANDAVGVVLRPDDPGGCDPVCQACADANGLTVTSYEDWKAMGGGSLPQ